MHTNMDLLLVRPLVREAKGEKINLLYDSGPTILLMKLKYLKDDALIYENKIALTGITGHKIIHWERFMLQLIWMGTL